jgi:hypothetical protein
VASFSADRLGGVVRGARPGRLRARSLAPPGSRSPRKATTALRPGQIVARIRLTQVSLFAQSAPVRGRYEGVTRFEASSAPSTPVEVFGFWAEITQASDILA